MSKARNLGELLASDGQVEDAKIDGVASTKLTGTIPDARFSVARQASKLPLTGGAMSGAITTTSTFDGRDVATDGTKLDAIEASATADQTNAEIRTAVEAATDSNVFNDADHTKLNAIEALADVTDTLNVTSAGALMDSELAGIAAIKATTGTFLTADQTKLDTIETSANLYVHPNHSGDVVSAADGAMTIQVDAVDIPMLSASGTASSSTFLRGDNAWAVVDTNLLADTSPQLGGNLDLNSNNITGTGGIPAANLTGAIPSAITATTQAEADDSTKIATTAYVVDKITTLIGGAPSTLNDLNELAAAINDDADYNSTLTTALGTKMPKAGGAFTGAVTTNSTFDGVDIATRDGVLTSTTATATAALPKAGGTLTGPLGITTASTVDTVVLTRGTTGHNNMLKFKTGSADKWIVGQRNDSTDHFRFYSYGTSSDVLSIQTDGKVGIGISAPTADLHIHNSADHTRLNIDCSNSSGDNWQFQSRNNGEFWLRNDDNSRNDIVVYPSTGDADFIGNITAKSYDASAMGVTKWYQPSNSGNPEFYIGSSDANRLGIQTVYDSGSQNLAYTHFFTHTANNSANAGRMIFSVDDGNEKLRIDDAGVDVTGVCTATSFAGDGAALTNIPSDVTVASSAPSVGAAGALYYNSTNGALYVSNGTVWGLVSNAAPTTTGGTVTIPAIEGGSASFSYNLGIDFTDPEDTDAQLTYTLESGSMPTGCTLPSAGNSSFTGSSSYVSSNTNYTWVIRATDTANAFVTQSYQQTINTIATFTNLQTTSMPHSGINVDEAGIRGGAGNWDAATENGPANTGNGFGWHDGHEGSPNDWPAYIAIYVGTAKAVNQLKIAIHSNSFGNFELQGSNNANTSGTFYNTGSWTSLTFNSSGSSETTQNGGGGSSGYVDGSVRTHNYTNNNAYTHYRIWFKDNSQPGSSGQLQGWATYGWGLNRV